MFCILCQAKIKAIKVSAQVTKLAEKAIKQKSSFSVGDTSRKKTKSMKATVGIILKLRCLAAFWSQLHIFTKVEKTKANV
jgi:hypothetical protein